MDGRARRRGRQRRVSLRWTRLYGAATFGRTSDYLLALVDNLQHAGVGVEQVQPEYSAGQVEISLPPATLYAPAMRPCWRGT